MYSFIHIYVYSGFICLSRLLFSAGAQRLPRGRHGEPLRGLNRYIYVCVCVCVCLCVCVCGFGCMCMYVYICLSRLFVSHLGAQRLPRGRRGEPRWANVHLWQYGRNWSGECHLYSEHAIAPAAHGGRGGGAQGGHRVAAPTPPSSTLMYSRELSLGSQSRSEQHPLRVCSCPPLYINRL